MSALLRSPSTHMHASSPGPGPYLPVLHYSTAGQPAEQASETWRHLMKTMYSIEPAERDRGGRPPGGGITVYRIGQLMANRTVYRGQQVARDRRLAATSPDHIGFQLCRSGGYHGDISGSTASLMPGTVALANRRRMLAGYISADTMGIFVPRHIFAGLDADTLSLRLDAPRNQLLAARVDALYRRLPSTRPDDVPGLESELTGFLRLLLDPSRASDVLEGPELDGGQFARAEGFIAARLGDPDLSPDTVAAALGISRATLYRLFASVGGVAGYIQERRFEALRDVLSDPLEMRSLTRLANIHGIRSLAHLSHSFRRRYGASPRAWREHRRAVAGADRGDIAETLRAWWKGFDPSPGAAGPFSRH